MQKPESKFNESEFFQHKVNKLIYSVIAKDHYKAGWLYTLLAPNLNDDNDQKYKRYYEDRMVTDTIRLNNQEIASILYKG